jgi:putative endonuclease
VTVCYIYMVRASDGSLYTGTSNDPWRRVVEHGRGKRGAKALRGKRPVRLLCQWRCRSRSDALRLEAKVKRLRALEKWSLALSSPSDPRGSVREDRGSTAR